MQLHSFKFSPENSPEQRSQISGRILQVYLDLINTEPELLLYTVGLCLSMAFALRIHQKKDAPEEVLRLLNDVLNNFETQTGITFTFEPTKSK